MKAIKEKLIKTFFLISGVSVILVLLGIFLLLLANTFPLFQEIAFKEFFSFDAWRPEAHGEPSYGIASLVISTLMVTFGAMIIAVPFGIASAAYLAEVASPWEREVIKPAVEILAGIPSVVIGFLGIIILGPLISEVFNVSSGLNAVNGSILLGIMALPTIISLSEDAITAVPNQHRSASLALGASRWQTLIRMILPAARSGIFASIMLGMGRAIGETMTVLMATGNAPALPSSFFDSVRTMSATIAIELGEVAQGSTHYYALFAVGFVLFAMTFAVNLASDIILNKYHEEEG